jgi:hypothetical protein
MSAFDKEAVALTVEDIMAKLLRDSVSFLADMPSFYSFNCVQSLVKVKYPH